MSRGRRLPGELCPGSLRTLAGRGKRCWIVEELAKGRCEPSHVTRDDHTSGTERTDRLGEPAHVVHDRRHPSAERLQERSALVDLRLVREQRDRRPREDVGDLVRLEPAEPPLRARSRGNAVRVQRFPSVSGDEEPRSLDPAHRLDRIAETLVRADQAERDGGVTVVAPLDRPLEHRMRDHPELGLVDSEGHQRRPAALAMDDDAVEPTKQPAPETGAMRRSPREQIVRREDQWRPRVQQPRVELRDVRPLEVHDVGVQHRQPTQSHDVLDRLHREPCPRAGQARRNRVEQVANAISVRPGDLSVAEACRDELDIDPGAREGGGERPVVRRRVRGGIRQDDLHRRRTVAPSMPLLVRSWNLFHGNTLPPTRRSHLREMVELAVSGRPDVVCLQEVPVWAVPRLAEWSGLRPFPAVARRGLRCRP